MNYQPFFGMHVLVSDEFLVLLDKAAFHVLILFSMVIFVFLYMRNSARKKERNSY